MRKRRLCLNRVKPRSVAAAQTSGLVNLVQSRQTDFFSSARIRLWLITELAVVSAWPLGLGSKLYPSNASRMLYRNLTRFMQSLSRVHQTSERKALLAGFTSHQNQVKQTWHHVCNRLNEWQHLTVVIRSFWDKSDAKSLQSRCKL